MAECPRGSRINRRLKLSRLSRNQMRLSAMVLPGIGGAPPVTTRVGMPSVWESTA
ncbi:hypothetical protein GCM10010467_19000 [Actinocorallia glomerata]|uniref:Uncharacterized protein n=2 Tax=Actinomycetes TaxID=1760 RepID=A0ABP6LTZ6_9MICC